MKTKEYEFRGVVHPPKPMYSAYHFEGEVQFYGVLWYEIWENSLGFVEYVAVHEMKDGTLSSEGPYAHSQNYLGEFPACNKFELEPSILEGKV